MRIVGVGIRALALVYFGAWKTERVNFPLRENVIRRIPGRRLKSWQRAMGVEFPIWGCEDFARFVLVQSKKYRALGPAEFD